MFPGRVQFETEEIQDIMEATLMLILHKTEDEIKAIPLDTFYRLFYLYPHIFKQLRGIG